MGSGALWSHTDSGFLLRCVGTPRSVTDQRGVVKQQHDERFYTQEVQHSNMEPV